MSETFTINNVHAQVAEAANRIERASIVAHWASGEDVEYHAERARKAFFEMAALLGFITYRADGSLLRDDADQLQSRKAMLATVSKAEEVTL